MKLSIAIPVFIASFFSGSIALGHERHSEDFAAADRSIISEEKFTSSHVAEFLDMFEEWTALHNKSYHNNDEKANRMMVWLENHLMIEEHNSNPEHTFTMSHNEYSDMTHDEFLQMFRLGKYSPGVLYPTEEQIDAAAASNDASVLMASSDDSMALRGSRKLDDLPTSIDWVEKGAVTSVKNQKSCGSCWAFSAVGSIEGLAYLETGELTDLSVQELVDCDKKDHGCHGGYMNTAFQFDEGVHGICAWEEYPYVGHRHWFKGCQKKKCDKVKGTDVTSFANVTDSDEGLMEALTVQPVSVAIEASGMGFMFYKKGIFSEKCGTQLDHGVLAVGYGTEDDKDYWIVKNSWGEKWGEDGYFRLPRGDEFEHGKCGVHKMASRPLYNSTSL